MVGRIMSRPEARKTPGKKMMTTTYKKGGSVKKKQGYNARKDEQLGMTRGKDAGKKEAYITMLEAQKMPSNPIAW